MFIVSAKKKFRLQIGKRKSIDLIVIRSRSRAYCIFNLSLYTREAIYVLIETEGVT